MSDEDEKVEEVGPRSFARFLQLVADGEAHAELGAELQKLMKALSERAAVRGNASGTLTLKLSFCAGAKRRGVDVNYEIVSKPPKAARAESVFWTDDNGNLVAEDPRQIKLPLRDVSGPAMRALAPPSTSAPAKSV